MFLLNIPDELFGFIANQLERFQVSPPSDICIDTIGTFITTYVVAHNYMLPPGVDRYNNPGLSEPECQALIPELEIILKLHKWQQITDTQLQLCIWASMLFVWSEEGREHVDWIKKYEMGEKDRAEFPLRFIS